MKPVVFVSVLITIQAFAITNVGGVITTNTVWGPTGNPPDTIYNLIDNIFVLDTVTLTIQPGVRIQASNLYRIQVNGRIVANGTLQDSILFTSNQQTPNIGDWHGISFINTSIDSSHLDYCIIEYAEYGIEWGKLFSLENSLIRCCTAGLCQIEGGMITNNEISNNSTAGINVGMTDTILPVISNNVINNNPCGVYVAYGPMPCYIVSNHFSGNNIGIEIWGWCEITEDMTWNPAVGGVDCALHSDLIIAASGKLTITPGNTFKMYGPTITVNGQLIACASADSMITFTSSQSVPNPGDWGGIWFFNSAIDSSKIDHCIIEYGRGVTSSFATPLLISRSIVRHNQGTGVLCSGNITIDSCQISNNSVGIAHGAYHLIEPDACFGANTISENYIGIDIYGNKLPVFHTPNQFSNNTHDIYITNHVFIRDEYVWNPAVDSVECYVNHAVTIDTSGTFIIAPGNRFKLYLQVFVHGRLIARGTETSKIAFTSQAPNPTPSRWGGITISPSSDSCIFSNCIIESAYFGIDGQARFHMDSCIVRECNWGIAAANAIINACQISNHTSYGVFCSGQTDSLLISNNKITDNLIGINCDYGAQPIITFNEIYDNIEYGVFNSAYNNYWIYAEDNWWGDSTGPCDTSDIDTLYNPNGLGDRVSDHVDYDPWIGFVGCVEKPTEAPLISNLFNVPYPNPFANATTFFYDLARDQHVKCVVYNTLGQAVRNLCDQQYAAGTHRLFWDGRDNSGRVLPPGVYWYRFEAESSKTIQKVIKLE
ncbi:MAG: right-handed parallel beta-helix repeat-containing protein [candidate division WOR-3 bacterium]|nr:MAG: right-handed parallel beta-helix repeat-containing protein [candidate division WOR-3 bacterium]